MNVPTTTKYHNEPIAIIGLAFEFPQGATSEQSFWDMIVEGRSASTEFPSDRLNIDAFYHPDENRPSTIPLRGGHFIEEDLGAFDAPFFSITPDEAGCMDPQHPRLLETTYHALEDSGVPISKCSGSNTSVYTGCFTNDYLSLLQQDYDAEQRHAAMGIAPSMLANRLSWFFNLKGTSMNLDSACSSSLIALHLACNDLRTNGSEMAIVGGANLVYHPNFMKIMSDFNFLSEDSRCWSFDEKANGYARGEGIAVIVLKRLSCAIRDGDTPSQEAQIDLIRQTYRHGDIDIEPTRFFEAHATGTPVGDPVEGNAIGQAFRVCRGKVDLLYIGAIKANIGHLEGCSGLAGIIKAILVLEKGIIPPIADFELLNGKLQAEELHLNLPTEVIPWPASAVRRACVNSFGFGRTNAVAILDDAYSYFKQNDVIGFHRTTPSIRGNDHHSGSNGQRSVSYMSSSYGGNNEILDPLKLITWNQSPQLEDLAYTTAVKRSEFPWRSFMVADKTLDVTTSAPVKASTIRRGIAFVFTGQGAHYLWCQWSLYEVTAVNSTLDIDRPDYSQPLTTCLQLAIVDLLKSFQIVPSLVLGHSSGEIGAAYAAGALSQQYAVKIAYHRGRLSSQLAEKAEGLTMMAVGLPKESIVPYLEQLQSTYGELDVAIGCVNSPQSITLTGALHQLSTLENWLKKKAIFARILRVPMAYHSRFMKAIEKDYIESIGEIKAIPGPKLTSNSGEQTTTQAAGQIVFPASGMIVMAIEGVRELLGDSSSLLGISIQNANFSHAIAFPHNVEKIETQLTLFRPSQSSDLSMWSQFRLFVLENDSYIECCSGFIRVVFDSKDRDMVISSAIWKRGETTEDWIAAVNRVCDGPDRNPYDVPEEIAVRYGPAFKNLEHLRIGIDGEAVAHVNTESWKQKSTKCFANSYLVHPATLDGLAQPLQQALMAQDRESLPTMVPVHVSSIWIDCSSGNLLNEGRLSIAARCSFKGYRGGSADVLATAIGSHIPLIFLDGLQTTFISSSQPAKIGHTLTPRFLCTKLVWKPDLHTMTSEQISLYCVQYRPKQEVDAVEKYQSLVVAIFCFILEAIVFLDEHPAIVLSEHLSAYTNWLRYQQAELQGNQSLVVQESVRQFLDDRDARERLVSEIENEGVDGYFFMQIGKNLKMMLSAEVDPLALMFHDGLADRYYEKMLANDHHAYPASQYIDLLSFMNPSMKILEVGAGTGGQTLRLLDAMSSGGVKKWSTYDYTDISPGFFSQAQLKFFKYADQMRFKVCDISKNPMQQSFEVETYDLVVASHVLHATDNLDQSLRNIRKLLKPDGRLLLFETTLPEAVPIGFAFGLLKGWWNPLNYEQRSLYSPCLTVSQWDQWLKRAGFSGVDVEIPGQEELSTRYSSIIISRATGSAARETTKPSMHISIIVKSEVEEQQVLAKLLASKVSEIKGLSCGIATLQELIDTEMTATSVIIFLTEIDAAFLDGTLEFDYNALQSVLIQTRQTIWATRAHLLDAVEPQHHLAVGLGRTLMSEDSTRKFVTVSLDQNDRREQTASLISELLQRTIDSSVENMENNYVVTDGKIHICRVSENVEMDRTIAQALLSLSIWGHRDIWKHLNGLRTSDKECFDAAFLNKNEVLIQVRAIGLTFRDHLLASGQLNEVGFGTECAGVLVATGSEPGHKVGDRVCVLATSAASSVIRTTKSAIAIVPEHMSFAEAASMPTAVWLSYRALIEVGRIEEDEIILIHRASSCIGQMTVQFAKRLGAKVLVTVSSSSSRKLLREEYMISENDIFDINDSSILNKIYRRTNGKGADIIVGPLEEGSHGISFDFSRCLAPFGRLIDNGLSNSMEPSQRPSLLGKRRTFENISRASVNLINALEENSRLVHATFQRAIKTAFELALKPPQPLLVFNVDKVESAFRHFHDPEEMGKRIIEINPLTSIMANVKNRPKYKFSSDASYIIAGGFGGLGRSFARWMVSRGARHLVLLSRSGAQGTAAKDLVAELISQRVFVAAPVVDISNLSKLKQVIEALKDHIPPIRGCIQATVALKDNLFPNMTYDDWMIGTSSKATGSWNLHATLPTGLDFFVLVASLNGIVGGRAQANYAAGNTFKDALAHHRISHGEQAVSIDLGLMVAEGVVAENEALLASMRRLGHLMDISQNELLALLEYYCDPALPLLTHEQAQVLVGLETPAAVLAKGIDLHHAIHRPLFRQLFRIGLPPGDNQSADTSAEKRLEKDRAGILRRTKSDKQASAMITEWFVAKMAQVLGLDVDDVDADKPVHAYGIDSLVAIDLKNWFARETNAEVQVFLLLGNTSLRQVAWEAATISGYRHPESK
ncbi:lovastatin nonaketide synthase [Sclerotinia borealis F-4128]|uniref:Lovastatin nonaketide synthase n=1 Tax=Sclerotinia borealis (strain F-4128) TaxID=1432307 RepID=W9CAY9_SCLBF|nr:lovastatin nonaketide synthase [Sclerotinia borealis F-4128]